MEDASICAKCPIRSPSPIVVLDEVMDDAYFISQRQIDNVIQCTLEHVSLELIEPDEQNAGWHCCNTSCVRQLAPSGSGYRKPCYVIGDVWPVPRTVGSDLKPISRCPVIPAEMHELYWEP